MNVSEPRGRLANSLTTSPILGESWLCSRTPEAVPIAAPITARSTTGDSLRRPASGWLRATTTSRPDNTARTTTISSMPLKSASAASRLRMAPSECIVAFAIFACQPRRADADVRGRPSLVAGPLSGESLW